MEKQTPSQSKIFSALFKADMLVQWRNRRASLMSVIVPILILISWRSIEEKFGGAFVLSSAITIGLVAIGLMGYANTTARDREKGVFQRLRVTPAGKREIMLSRIAVQLVQIAVMSAAVILAGYFVDHIVLSAAGYVLGLLASLVCGAVFLGLGLAIVGLIENPETVNSVSRLVYIMLIVIGAVGELGVLGNAIKGIVLWTPYGTVKAVLLATMASAPWSGTEWLALVATLAYAVVFIFLGIRWFKWGSK